MTAIGCDGLDSYNGTGASPGLQAGWTNSGSGTISLATGRFGVGQRVALSGANSSARALTKQLTTSYGSLAIGTMIKATTMPTGTAQIANLMLLISGTTQVGWRIDANGAFQVYRYSSTSAGTLLGSSANGVIVLNTEHYVETEIVISPTVGRVTIYVDNVQVVNLTSQNTRNHASLSTADQFLIGFSNNLTGGAGTIEYDDIYWEDSATKLGERRVETIYPNADGATLDWTPSTGTSHFAVVDEPQASATDYLSASTVGNIDLLDLGNLASTPPTIDLIQVVAYALKTDAASRSIALGVKSGATTSSGANKALASSIARLERVLLTDPNTSSAWTGAAVNALQVRPEVTV